jgi:O-acetyl-ADP-ribose deacetylase (regulator of RNase III)
MWVLIKSYYIMATQVKHIIGNIGRIGDIPDLQLNTPVAVVNAGNETLSPGGGVTGALVQGVGGVQAWTRLIGVSHFVNGDPWLGRISMFDVVISGTSGHLLDDGISSLYHVRGPRAGLEPMDTIRTIILNLIHSANQNGIKTLILPAISGGIFSGNDAQWPRLIRQLIRSSVNEAIQMFPGLDFIYLISYDKDDQELWELPDEVN